MRGKYFNNPRPPRVNRRDADKLIDATRTIYMALSIMALRDEFGFGTKRLERFVEKIRQLVIDQQNGYLNIEDICDTIYAETGIKIII